MEPVNPNPNEEFKSRLDKIGADTIAAITELKAAMHQEIEEAKANNGTVSSETKEKIERIETRLDQLGAQLNRPGDGGFLRPLTKSVGEQYVESEQYKAAKGMDFRIDRPIRGIIGSPLAERKAVITTVGLGSGTSGILMPMRLPGVTGLPMQTLRVTDLMTHRQMTQGNAFDYVRMLARTNAASPQVEGSPKAESTYTWQTVSDTVKTIAAFTNVSRQGIEDVPWLQGIINSELMYGLLLKVESEVLTGDGTGQHMKGLITQATAYNTALNVAADQSLDKLRHAKLQARLVGLGTFAPDGIVVNPTDLARIELIKDEAGGANKGRYIVGDPTGGPAVRMIWGLPTVESDSIAPGFFLVGAFSTAAEIIDRMQAVIEISYENASNFTSNLATILSEIRLGLAVRRPEAFVYGAF